MADHLVLPAIFKTSYTNLESNSINPTKTEKNYLLIGYYLILIVCVIGTALIIDRTGLARTIMDASRTRISRETRIQNEVNLAAIEIDPESGLRVLIFSPQNQYLGETTDGVRYLQIQAGIIDHHHNVSLQMAQSGLYNLEFSAKNPGSYSVTLTLKDSTGKRSTRHTEKLIFIRDEHIRYNLDFNNQQLPDSNLVFKNIFYRN